MAAATKNQDRPKVRPVEATEPRQASRDGEPEYDDSISLEENVYLMKHAGLTWNRLEKLCGLKPWGPAMRAYRIACEARGEQPRDFRKKQPVEPKPQPKPKKRAPAKAKKAPAKKAPAKGKKRTTAKGKKRTTAKKAA